MKQVTSQDKKLLADLKKTGPMRLAEIVARGTHPEVVRRLYMSGKLQRIGRGIYATMTGAVSEHQSLILAATRIPHGIVCLLSALQFYQIGTQLPREVWIAIGNKDRAPKPNYPPLKVVRLSGASFKDGIRQIRLGHIMVSIYCPAKTVVDCFKFRNKFGLDIALEALRDSLQKKKATRHEIEHYARLCRMFNIMKPYLEMEAVT